MSKTSKELNDDFIEMVKSLKDQPGGAKTLLFNERSLTPVEQSEKAAKLHSSQLKKKKLKETLEQLGEKYSVSPALIAAIGSRESGLGTLLEGEDSQFYGWGDKSKRAGENDATFHGFGLLQLDRNMAPSEDVRKKLNDALNENKKLNPYDTEWIENGVKAFVSKQERVQIRHSELSSAEQCATAVSQYNGGNGRAYPENDQRTTNKDYANDVLIRARWFAEHWDDLK
jgi:hypothetical protein